ncbi:hypothetical protein J7643_08340 [bacterium]|nr:hypothetical protein [bacterium]
MNARYATLLLGLLTAAPALAAEQWAPATKTQDWSSAPTTERRSLENERLSPALKPDADLTGTWDLRIPAAVTYFSKEANLYRRITPGADLNRLVIKPSGDYRWGRTTGKLRALKPWFAQPDVRYFEVKNAQGTYVLYAKTAQELVLLFDVGGFAAKGTRSR